MDLALRETLDTLQPPDLRPQLHAKQRPPPGLDQQIEPDHRPRRTTSDSAPDGPLIKTEPIDIGVDPLYAWGHADAEALASAFRRAGFQPRIETYLYRGAGITDWVITVTVATPVIAFFQSFGSELGQDAYIQLKQWFRDVRDRGPGKGSIVVRDSRYGGRNVVLDSDLPG